MKLHQLFAVLVAVLPWPVYAASMPQYVLLEYASGGDKLVEPDSGDSLRAGDLLQVSWGYRFFSDELPEWEVDVRAGLRFATLGVSGGDATFIRYPLELAFHRRLGEKFALGLGIAYHVNPSYRFDTNNADDRIDFEDATGGFVQFEWRAGKRLGLALRYLQIEYEKDDATFLLPNGDVVSGVDGSATGLYMTYAF